MYWLSKEKRTLGRVRGRPKPRVAEGADAGRDVGWHDGRESGKNFGGVERSRKYGGPEVGRGG